MNGLGQRAFGDRFNLARQFSTMSLKLSIRGVETGGTGGADRPPDFDKTVNYKLTRLCLPRNYSPPQIFEPSYRPLKIVNVEAAKYLVGPDRKSSRNICRNDNLTTKKGKTRKLPLECFEIFGVILKIIRYTLFLC